MDNLYDPAGAKGVIKSLPTVHKRVLCYLIDFLQKDILPIEKVTEGLARTFGECLMRALPSEKSNTEGQTIFIRNLIGSPPSPPLLLPLGFLEANLFPFIEHFSVPTKLQRPRRGTNCMMTSDLFLL